LNNLKMKTKNQNTLKPSILSLALLALASSGCSTNGKFVENPSAYLETALVSDYVTRHGARVKGIVRQDLVAANVNQNLSCFVWQNYSFKEDAVNDRDFGVDYSIPLTEDKNLSASFGLRYFDYPSGSFGNYDYGLEGILKYHEPKTKIDSKLIISQALPHDNSETGIRFCLKAERPFQIYENKKGKVTATLTPNFSTSYVDNYFGFTGWSQSTFGIDLGVTKKFEKFDLSAGLFVNQQFGNLPNIESFTWSGFKLSVNF